MLREEPFVAEAASFKSYPNKVCILKMRGSERFWGIQVIVPPESGENLEAKRFRVSPDSPSGGLHINLNWPGEKEGREVPFMRTFRDDYAMILEFGTKTGGRIPGRIYVCLPDKEHSVVAGTFTIAP